MKTIILVSLFLMGVFSVLAGNKTEEFKVYGNCGMCEKRIEKAAKSLDGVSAADWNKETKMIEVKYDPAKVEVIDIQKAIAKVGHDTEKETAKDEVYNDLPACCKYDRKKD
jgi:copper chaperone CopZ